MKYSELAKVKTAVYAAAIEDAKRYTEEAAKAELLTASEKLDALYGAARGFKKALKAAREQHAMERKYDEAVTWTIDEVIALCRDMDGACERCPLYSTKDKRCTAGDPGGTLEAACQGAGFEQVEQEDNEEEEQ